MLEELISVIIPIYNGERYIKSITEAICNQTYKNLEIIVVNDGSKDNTLNLCGKYMSNDERFKIFSKENGGASSARNYGLKKATGNYIAFIDVDDYIFPEYFIYLYDLLAQHKADMSCCSYYKMWDDERVPQFHTKDVVKEYRGKEALIDLLYRRNITGYPCLKLYKKSVVEKLEFPSDISYGEDAIFTVQALKQCEKIVYGSKILYIYYQHNNSSTHMVDCSKYNSSWDIHKRDVLGYAKIEKGELLQAAYAKLFILAIDYCCRIWKAQGDKSLRKELLEYIKYADGHVLRNKQCKLLNRFLALLSCINTSLMIQICRFYNYIKNTFHFETRKSV